MQRLPVLKGPPGHEHLSQLALIDPAIDVRRRRRRRVPEGVPTTARAVAEALFSPDGRAPDRERLDYIEEDFADFFARSNGYARLILRLSLFALMWVAPLFIFRPVPLSSLTIERRAHALEKFEASPLAPAALAVKAMLCLLWFEHPTTQRETNTDPSCLRSSS